IVFERVAVNLSVLRSRDEHPGVTAAEDGVVPDDAAVTGLVKDAVAGVVLDAVAFDDRARVAAVVPDAIALVVMDEVVAEGHALRIHHFLFLAVVGNLVVLDGGGGGEIAAIAAAAQGGVARGRIAIVVMDVIVPDHRVAREQNAVLGLGDLVVLNRPVVSHPVIHMHALPPPP